MIVGLILAGSVIGAGSALAALILGQPVWMALLIYSGAGVASVLAGAAMAALRATPEGRAAAAEPYPLAPPQRS